MAFSVCIVVVVVVVAGIFGTFSKESLLPLPGISEPEEMDFPPYSFFLLPFFKHLNHWIELSNFAFQFGRWKKTGNFIFPSSSSLPSSCQNGKKSNKQWMNERTLNEVNWNRLTMVNWAYTDGHVRCDMVTYMEKTFYSWMNNFFSLFLFGYYSKQSG